MHIRELASRAGVNIQTVRFYERQGLLPPPLRNESGYRCYAENDIERMMFIKRNQELGFSLTEVKQLMELHRVVAAVPKPLRRKPHELHGIIAIGRERLDAINQKIRTLHAMRRQLVSMIKQLESPVVLACPVSKEPRPATRKCPQKSS